MGFKRTVEDFTCEHCGTYVKGDGYTNHCPKCLWSKHLDVEPGDRAAVCGGMMEPIALEGTTPKYRIIQRCLRCKVERPIGISKGDDMRAALAIAGNR
ncbi:RNHCP domain-containing protein [Candidatus Kaiserbacteria bacterium]|nr:RNHCP domain-containing protein [Candidatus Kaiserbacteria bacterium]